MQPILRLGIIAAIVATAPGAIAQTSIAGLPRTTSRAAARQTFTTTIQGNALTSTNGQLANVSVRLRDVRYGRVLGTTSTDKAGLFTFHVADPGSYIVEILGADQTSVLAASQILNVDAGDMVSAIVKLPFRLPPFAGLLGGNVASATPASATAIITQAAANGILVAATPPGDVDSCPVQK